MSTYSTNLALELIGTGEQAGSWGNTTNTNLGTLIEQAISGYVTQAVSTGTDTTITIPNGATGVARNMYIELTGTGGTNTNLIVPANKKLYFIFNNSTGAVTVKVSGQTGVSVPTGKKMVLVSDGTDIVNGLNYIADFGSNSATITQLSATSATITNLTLTSLVVSNLSISSANITTLTGTTATFTSGTVTNLNSTSANITTLTGTTFGTTATTQLRGASGQITTLTSTSSNITTLTGTTATFTSGTVTNLNSTSANITTLTGTTATFTSGTVTNLNSTSANITTLTGTTFGTTATTQLRGASGQITTLTSTSADITTLTGTTFGTTATTQLRGASGQITTLTSTSANITTLTGTTLGTFTSGTVTTLTSTSANITTLTSTSANITTLGSSRVNPRVSSTTTATSLTPSIAVADQYAFTALASALTINAPIGTPLDGNKLIFRILDNGTSRALTWNATYTVIGVTLPTATTISKTTYVGCIYNANNTRWDVVAVTTQA